MKVTNLTSDIHFYLVGPAVPLAPGEARYIADVHRQDLDIDALINAGSIKTEDYSKYGASVVVQPELDGSSGPTPGTDDVLNDSTVPGVTATDALDWLYDNTNKRYKYTLTAADISAKGFLLPSPPTNLTRVVMRIRCAPDQVVGVDFQVIFDGTVRWPGYPLDGILSVGDIVEVVYA